MTYIYDSMRHLVCVPYSIENLHKMAEDLSIKRCWFHNSKYPHYDIPKKRTQEIADHPNTMLVSSYSIIDICKGMWND